MFTFRPLNGITESLEIKDYYVRCRKYFFGKNLKKLKKIGGRLATRLWKSAVGFAL